MIEYTTIDINDISDYDQVLKVLNDHRVKNPYMNGWLNQLKQCVGMNCTCLCIESPYYDSEYLSSYYEFYSKKFKNYPKESSRIHFMKDSVYCGYVTVSLLSHYLNLSKSYLDPRLLLRETGYLLLSEFTANVYGIEHQVNAFPWMNQQHDFSACAHVAAWSIMKYYGNEHTGYHDVNIGQVVDNIPEGEDRKLPSKGLNLRQIADVFRVHHVTPLIIRKEEGEEMEFFRELLAYIESGIPVVAAMDKKAHAVAVIGHGKVDEDIPKDSEEFVDHTSLIHSIFVNDDNILPYHIVKQREFAETSEQYCIEDIDFMIVPLYNRIHLEYAVVYQRVMSYLNKRDLDIHKNSVIRIYLASANSLKKAYAEAEDIDDELKDIVLRSTLPKFVWCVDIAAPDEYRRELTSAKMIIDSTSCDGETTPWLIIHDGERIDYCDCGQWYREECKIKPYRMYRHNLKERDPWK